MTSRSTYAISRQALDKLVKRAVANAKRGGREVCGLLVERANVLTLVHLRNKVKRGGSWAFYVGEARRAIVLAERAGGEGVGSFHSHPIGVAEPGPSDIAHAPLDSLMLIVDCLGEKCALWRIDGRKATRLRLVKSS